MDSDDVIDPADAELHALLGQIADRTDDEERRERILGVMVTLPPIADWPPDMLERARATHAYVRGLRRDLQRRELEAMYAGTEGDG
ncbi:hypothetical protein F0Q45_21385 [Mycobacterium simiae]|uniref:Uncharacterized protein n=1 Tax=Mycobacterium simiae TaxID=1784 RepID=A0A5B1BMU0_MYCSI|nr:hypothetical protein [Mycobacterium simiae]KAA1248289.1 hypothetical protein F0Q45_21385 [Mycobacterium simiae]